MRDLAIFKTIDFDQVNEYECVRKEHYNGFAHFYLSRCDGESKSDDEIDQELYAQLLEIDTRLGNQLGGNILRDAGINFEKCQDYDWIKKETEYAGFADYFLAEYGRRDNDANSDADAASYRTLVYIDAVLGTDAALQLFRCINKTTRSDMIKV